MTRPRPGQAWRELAARQKPGGGVPWYMREVNRRFGRALAALASPTRLTPNHLTTASFAAFLTGVALLALLEPGVGMAVAATLLLQLGFALDSADGQLSRLRGTGGPSGEWLDHVVDAARHQVFHYAVLIGWVRFTDLPEAMALVPLGFAVASSVRFFAQILAEQLARRDPLQGLAHVPRFASWIQAPADTGVVNFVVLLWPVTTVFAVVYTVVGALNVLLLLATVLRRYRELDRKVPA